MASQRLPQTNPSTPKEWRAHVATRLEPRFPGPVKLENLLRCRGGQKTKPSGSNLQFDEFLHFRALIIDRGSQFNPREFIKADYAQAAAMLLKRGGWPNSQLQRYLEKADRTDPYLNVEGLGIFGAAKISQNQALISASQSSGHHDDDDDDDDNRPARETPVKTPGGRKRAQTLTNADAADEMTVNQAIIEYLIAISRDWMYTWDSTQPSPSKHSAAVVRQRNAQAAWTIERNVFHIKVLDENRRPSDKTPPYKQIIETRTDGHLYSTAEEEVLALVEAKARIRDKRRLMIEWQETAEILAWLNLRCRTERDLNLSRSERRGLLLPTDRKSRLVSMNAQHKQPQKHHPHSSLPPSLSLLLLSFFSFLFRIYPSLIR